MTSTVKNESVQGYQASEATKPLKDNANADTQQPKLVEMEAEIARYKGLLQTLSDAVDAKVSYVDKNQRYRFVNKQYEQWYETTADQLVGKTVYELMGEEYQHVKSYVESALSGNEVRYDCPLNFSDGQVRYLQITHIPHFNDSQEVIGIFVVCVDITEQKRLHEELEQLKATKA
ncbi:MAG TPA: PAS domain-containing protein [Coleofasciculaceae cyanobacterium]|jgi:PAS domain S-box-containing protein